MYIDLDRVEEEKRNECVGRYESYLRRLGVLDDATAEEIKNEALETMRRGIAEAEAWVVNRAGFDPKPYNQRTADAMARSPFPGLGSGWLLYGPEPSIVAEAPVNVTLPKFARAATLLPTLGASTTHSAELIWAAGL